jgi:hypothetical protein
MTAPTKVPAIPKPPASVDSETRRYLESLKEAIEIRLGRRGAPEDRAVTLRELIEGGVATAKTSVGFDPNNFNTGNLGFGASATPDEIDSSIPPAPANFTATAAYSSVNLKWDIPTYGNLSHTEIWFNDTDDTLADALLLDISTGFFYTDQLGSDKTRYYWIRFISEDGIVGPYNATDGTKVETSEDVAFLLSVLNESITSSELHSDLSTPIGNLPSDTNASFTAANAKINALKSTPTWVAAGVYEVGDLVSYGDKLYACITAHTDPDNGNTPSTDLENTPWQLIGEYSSLIDVISQTETTRATLSSDYLTTTDTNQAIATESTSIKAEFFTNAFGLDAWDANATYTYDPDSPTLTQVSYNNKIYKLTQGETSVSSTNDTPADDSEIWEKVALTTSAAVNFDHYTIAEADSAISTATTGLVSSTDLDGYVTNSTLTNNYMTSTDTTSAIATATTGLVSSTDLGDYVTSSTLTTNYMTSTETDSAISLATNNLRTEVQGAFEAAHTYDFTGSNTNGFTGIRATVTANANYLVYDETSSDASLNLVDAAGTIDGFTNRIVQVKIMRKAGNDWQGWLRYSHSGESRVSFSDQDTYVQVSPDPTILDEWVIVEFDMTNAPGWDDTVDDLRFDFGNNGSGKFHIEWIKIGANTKTLNAALQTQQTSVDGVEANYTVKIDNNGSIAGFGLASTTSDAGNVTSEFIVAADKFALMPSTDSAIADWTTGSDYSVGDQVKQGGNFWICHSNHTPYSTRKPDGENGPLYWNQTDKTPFSVLTSPQNVTVGTETVTIDPGVYIDAAYIKDASITAAKVGQLDANAITTGEFSADRIDGGTIDTSTINITGTSAAGINIKSANSGARTEYRSKSIRVYDGSRLRVHIGDLSDI